MSASFEKEPLHRQCIVCEEFTTHEIVYEKWDYPILRCFCCRLGSVGSDETVDVASIYSESYFTGSQYDPEVPDEKPENKLRNERRAYVDYAGSEPVLRAEFGRALADLRRCGPKEGRLLEIGCAYGFFLLEAQQYFSCIGIDISEAAVAFCLQRGLDVYQGEVDEQLLERGPFDAVVMLDCIEHLRDPARTLALAWQALKPQGVLMITTGDWDSLVARITGRH